MLVDKALNATFQDERRLDAMQISAFIWVCVCDSLTKACQRFSLPFALFFFFFVFVSWGTRFFCCCCKCSIVAKGYCEDATKTAYDVNMFETNSFWSQRVVIVPPFNQSERFRWFCAPPKTTNEKQASIKNKIKLQLDHWAWHVNTFFSDNLQWFYWRTAVDLSVGALSFLLIWIIFC